MQWTVIRYEVLQKYPALGTLIQSAANSQSHIAQQDLQAIFGFWVGRTTKLKFRIIYWACYRLHSLLQQPFFAMQETELQICRKIWNQIKGASNMNAITWDVIKAAVLRSKPACGSFAPFLFTWVLNYGGGRHGNHLLNTDNYVRSFGHPGKS